MMTIEEHDEVMKLLKQKQLLLRRIRFAEDCRDAVAIGEIEVYEGETPEVWSERIREFEEQVVDIETELWCSYGR